LMLFCSYTVLEFAYFFIKFHFAQCPVEFGNFVNVCVRTKLANFTHVWIMALAVAGICLAQTKYRFCHLLEQQSN
jgi:hypothetical protein